MLILQLFGTALISKLRAFAAKLFLPKDLKFLSQCNAPVLRIGLALAMAIFAVTPDLRIELADIVRPLDFTAGDRKFTCGSSQIRVALQGNCYGLIERNFIC
jgi:hypothetical protein